MSKSSDRALAAAAVAAHKPKVIPEGHGLHLSRNDWYHAVRGERVNPPAYDAERERITVVTDHTSREYYKNEAGEWL